MPADDPQLDALREALSHSPDNAPLRRMLAERLLESGASAEAEEQYRACLESSPGDPELQLGLARAYQQQHKHSHALAIVEMLVSEPAASSATRVLHARLLFDTGEVAASVAAYRRVLADDPGAADPGLSALLGIDADESSEVVDGRVRAFTEEAYAAIDELDVEQPTIRFEHVGGMDALKEEVRMKIIHPLERPELFEAYGKKIGGGILLFGPPGCGKTHIARATAGEVDARFLSVALHDVLNLYVGQSEQNLHSMFEQARRYKPSVLFFDEVDALAAKRSDQRQSASRQVINQFLAELDGIDATNDGLLVLAATNAPWHLDSAFRRPGRFDRILFVPPPDSVARAAILGIHLEGKPCDEVDVDAVAKKTPDCSGADLKAVVDLAIEEKLKVAMKEGMPRPLTTRDLLKAAKRVRPSTKEWFATARNYALYSNESGTYDEILDYLEEKR